MDEQGRLRGICNGAFEGQHGTRGTLDMKRHVFLKIVGLLIDNGGKAMYGREKVGAYHFGLYDNHDPVEGMMGKMESDPFMHDTIADVTINPGVDSDIQKKDARDGAKRGVGDHDKIIWFSICVENMGKGSI